VALGVAARWQWLSARRPRGGVSLGVSRIVGGGSRRSLARKLGAAALARRGIARSSALAL